MDSGRAPTPVIGPNDSEPLTLKTPTPNDSEAEDTPNDSEVIFFPLAPNDSEARDVPNDSETIFPPAPNDSETDDIPNDSEMLFPPTPSHSGVEDAPLGGGASVSVGCCEVGFSEMGTLSPLFCSLLVLAFLLPCKVPP